MQLITPPLPAASRPSNTTTTLAPVAFTHSCISTSLVWSSRNAFWYSFPLSFSLLCSSVPFALLFAIDRNLPFLPLKSLELHCPEIHSRVLGTLLRALISHDLGWRRFTDNCASDRAKAALTDATS